MIRQLFGIAAIGLLAASVPVARAVAQTPTANPHGKLFQDCASCHRSDRWAPVNISATYKHSTRFPLAGAHAATTCRSCHLKLDFTGTDARCSSCHRDPHLGELGSDCARCHNAASFIDRTAMLRAHQVTRFPLAGAHRMADCESCHVPASQGQRRFAGRSTECASCHQRQLLATKNPDHVAAGFSTNCGSCHSPTYWNRAAYDHSASGFPLTGAHRTATCSACHTTGVYRGIPATCVSCHLTDYQATTNPNHATAQFPTECASCHTPARWQGATFNHDVPYFPIYSGKHRGTWSSCATCHTNASDFKVFSCTSCHAATATNEHHKEVSGYAYDSRACYSCHRDGRKP